MIFQRDVPVVRSSTLSRRMLLPATMIALLMLICRVANAVNAPTDEEKKQVLRLVEEDKTREAIRQLDQLIAKYPGDEKLKALRKQLGNPAEDNSATPKPTTKSLPGTTDGVSRLELKELQLLIREASEMPVGSAQRVAKRKEYLKASEPIVQKNSDVIELWRCRAEAALEVPDPASGYTAGQNLLRLGAADSSDDGLLTVVANIKRHGWLEPLKMGELYRKGTGVTQDYAEAMKWFQKAADAGNADGVAKLGELYFEGEGVTQDYAEAMKWFKKAADAGSALGANGMAKLYVGGKGVAQDYTEAMKWCKKAADAGSTEGANNIGWLYFNGKGVTQDYAEAMKWYKKSADAGGAVAANNVGGLYHDGKGVTQDYAEAMKWFKKAADAGCTGGTLNVGWLYFNGKGVTQDYPEAVKWFRKAADIGDFRGMEALGFIYDSGKDGVPEDKRLAAEWMRKAAVGGSDTAKKWLKDHHLD